SLLQVLVEQMGTIWALFRYMPGRAPAPRSVAGTILEQRMRGRLLARLHQDMAALVKVGQRPGWRRADEGLVDRTGKLPGSLKFFHFSVIVYMYRHSAFYIVSSPRPTRRKAINSPERIAPVTPPVAGR